MATIDELIEKAKEIELAGVYFYDEDGCFTGVTRKPLASAAFEFVDGETLTIDRENFLAMPPDLEFKLRPTKDDA